MLKYCLKFVCVPLAKTQPQVKIYPFFICSGIADFICIFCKWNVYRLRRCIHKGSIKRFVINYVVCEQLILVCFLLGFIQIKSKQCVYHQIQLAAHLQHQLQYHPLSHLLVCFESIGMYFNLNNWMKLFCWNVFIEIEPIRHPQSEPSTSPSNGVSKFT